MTAFLYLLVLNLVFLSLLFPVWPNESHDAAVLQEGESDTVCVLLLVCFEGVRMAAIFLTCAFKHCHIGFDQTL